MAIVLDGTTGITAPSATVSGTVQGAPVRGGLVSGTAVTVSGTSVDFTDIPAWVKRITVMFSGVSTNGTSLPQIQLGDAGGVENTGYAGTSANIKSGVAVQQMSAGFTLAGAANWLAASVVQGGVTISNVSGNTWAAFGMLGGSNDTLVYFTAGSKTLSDTLTQVRITTVNGTDAFDAGSINILYEG
jgi:hypothetical protein